MYNSQNAHPTLSNHQHSEGLLAHWHLLMAELRGPGTELCLTACPSIQQLWGLLPRPAPPTGKAQAGPPPAPPPRKGTSQPSSPQSPRKGTSWLSSTPTQGHMLAQHPPPGGAQTRPAPPSPGGAQAAQLCATRPRPGRAPAGLVELTWQQPASFTFHHPKTTQSSVSQLQKTPKGRKTPRGKYEVD